MYKGFLVAVEVVLVTALVVYLINPTENNSEEYSEHKASNSDYQKEEKFNEKEVVNLVGGEVSKEILPPKVTENHTATYLVTRVIDGDTIEVEIEGEKKRVRYIGVDTPETVHPSKPVQCFGKEASEFNKNLVEGNWVRLEKDISETDKYGRLLRYVYVGEKFVNLELVGKGYADVITYPPDVKYTEVFLIAKREAQAEKRGLWGEQCGYADVAENPIIPATNSRGSSCVIKGNINAEKVKIFHVPGCEYYDRTVVSEKYGERWFCTEEEALEAGWRKALNCL